MGDTNQWPHLDRIRQDRVLGSPTECCELPSEVIQANIQRFASVYGASTRSKGANESEPDSGTGTLGAAGGLPSPVWPNQPQ